MSDPIPLTQFRTYAPDVMAQRATEFYAQMRRRRTVRDVCIEKLSAGGIGDWACGPFPLQSPNLQSPNL